jgi:hypothetical protein
MGCGLAALGGRQLVSGQDLALTAKIERGASPARSTQALDATI